MRITADTSRCIGAGMCVLTAPELFDQNDDDGTVILLEETPSPTSRDTARRAVRSCPSGALSISDD
ncbi:ferredoxin [Sphaerisporangium sp. B11E5]|uniref:ferredoxin n=1 Tax=Sphaerisporangium sp. B11E5 TaxID=3153563 RepID=UPI00325F7B90